MRGTLHNSLLVCAFALTLAGCGSDDGTIPPDDAETMLNYIEAAQEAVEEGDCERAEDNASELIDVVNGLPNDVDPEVAGELTKAAQNMRTLASDPDQCETGASGEEGVEPTDTTQIDTTAVPTTTETTTEETTTEEDPEDQTTTDEEPTSPEPESPEPQSPEPTAPPGGGNQGGGTVEPQPGGGSEPPSGGVTPGGGDG